MFECQVGLQEVARTHEGQSCIISTTCDVLGKHGENARFLGGGYPVAVLCVLCMFECQIGCV